MTATAITLDETEAAVAEGLLPFPTDLLPLRARKLKLDQQRDKVQSEIDAIKATFDQRLQTAGAQGFVLDGKVHARRTEVRTNRLDGKALKEKHPRIWAAFTNVTKSVRISIT